MTPESAGPRPESVAAFFQKHRTGFLTIVFTDLVDSTALMERLGNQAGATYMQRRRQVVREVLGTFAEGEEIETAGDSFLLAFAKPSDAVRFALIVQGRFREISQGSDLPIQERIGIHLGELVIAEHETEVKAKDLYGIQLATCARVMSLAQGGQVLLTRGVFDSARQVLKGEDLPGVGPLSWVSHGPYVLKGIEEPVEVCEVGEVEQSSLTAPKTSDKAQRQVRADEEPVLGWRPAVGQEVPNTKWVLEEKLGEGGFGEVWVGRHQTLKEQHVFKFCFRADRVRSLKREVTLFRLLKERVGEHPGIVRLHNVYFDQPPFYLEEEYVSGKDLKSWCEAQGGIEKVPLETRLEIMAQAAEALQAAHDAGIIHRDVKPGNILVSGDPSGSRPLVVKLTDFGIGQVISAEYLKGVTQAGFTQTMAGSTSSGTGTAMYLAPEIIAGQPATTRSDIYSLGVVLYQLLTRDFRRPVTTDWQRQVADLLLRADLEHCFAGNPEERFAGAAQLAKSLRNLEQRQVEVARQQAKEAERGRLRRQAEQQHRIMMVSAVVATLLLLLTTVLGFGLRRAERHRRVAEEARQVQRRHTYAADMRLAQHAFEEGNLGRVVQLVQNQIPEDGEDDLRGFEWRYFWDLSREDALFSFIPHDSPATCVAFSPDGETLATGSFDGTVRLRDVRSGRMVQAFGPFTEWICRNSLLFSASRKLLAVNCGGDIMLWDTSSWKELRRLKGAARAVGFDSYPISLSPNGRTVAAKTPGGVGLWDVDSAEQRVIPGERSTFGDLAVFAPDEETLAVADNERVSVWSATTMSLWAELDGKGSRVVGLAISGHPTVVAAGREDGTVVLWDLKKPNRPLVFKAHKLLVFGLAFAPDNDTLATGGADQVIHLWSIRAILGVSGDDLAARATSTASPLVTLRGHGNQVWALAFSLDGTYLASASKDGEVKLWDAHRRPAETGLSGAWLPMAFSPTGQHLLVLHFDKRLRLWDRSARTETVIEGISVENVMLQSPTASVDGKTFAMAKPGEGIEVWDLSLRQPISRIPWHGEDVKALKLSPDGRLLAVSGRGRTTILEARSGKMLSARSTPAVCHAFSPDGTRFAAPGSTAGHGVGAAAQVWGVTDTEGGLVMGEHKINLASLAFSPNGQLLAIGGHDNLIGIWDTTKCRRLVELSGHLTSVRSLAFSPDSRTLASGATDGTVKLWHFATGQEMCSRQFFLKGVTSLLFSPAGDALAIGSLDSASPMHIWRAQSLAEIDAFEKAQASAGAVGGR
jgi:WD40 repeat protein/serine/threonine protein kinase/class 3 adenylate cyclase